MESLICANPLRIRRHYRRNSASIGIKVIEKSFCEMYISICDNFKEGMKLCKDCRNILENSTPTPLKCIDPHELGDHSSSSFIVVSTDTQRLFYPLRNKLPLAASICKSCYESLKDLTKNVSKPTVAQIPNICCNPFNKADHSAGNNYRFVTQKMELKFSNESNQIFVNDKICSTCRAILYRSDKTEKMEPGRDLLSNVDVSR